MYSPRPRLSARPLADVLHVCCWLIALVPVAFIGSRLLINLRNIPFWDEYDAMLGFVVALDEGTSMSTIWELLFAVHNEHRMVVSRLVVAGFYWITGAVNFATLAVVGNLYLVGACAILVATVKGWQAQARFAAVLGLGIFQLEHHENFFWAGSSIDHFFVVLCAVGGMVALATPGRLRLSVAVGCGVLGTFSLAHGLAIWVAGATMLALERRWRESGWWLAAAIVSGSAFFWGFTVNPQHQLPGTEDFAITLRFWLTLIGGAPAIGDLTTAPWAGGALLCALGWLGYHSPAMPRERRVAVVVATFAVVALAMIAYGRTYVSAGYEIPSRYYVLSALVLTLVVWTLIEHWLDASVRRPVYAVGSIIALAVFNFVASSVFIGRGVDFNDDRAAAVARYRATGSLDHAGPFKLYPKPAHAERIVVEAERRGVYRFPEIARPVQITSAVETGDAAYFFDAVSTTAESIFLRGWAVRDGKPSKRGNIRIVLRSDGNLLAFKPVARKRKDVAATLGRRDVDFSGFVMQMPRTALAAGSYQVGIAFKDGTRVTYTMTGHHVEATGFGADSLVASDPAKTAD